MKALSTKPVVPAAPPGGMEICPTCRKRTAPQFMWRSEDPEVASMCLACFHAMPEPERRRYEPSALRGESKAAKYVMKAIGSLLLVTVLFVGGICLFYKPHPTQIAKKADPAPPPSDHKSTSPEKKGDSAGKAAGEQEDEDGSPTEKSVETKGDAAKQKAGDKALAVGGAKGDGKQRMAPTTSAVAANLSTKKGEAKPDVAAPSSLKAIIEQATAAADAMHSDSKEKSAEGDKATAGVPAIKPNEKTKAEAEKTKEAALNFASAVIQKNDKDGTKSAEALAKLGQISTAFADVATKMTDGIPATSGKSGATGAAPAHGSTRLESDVLATQGNAGYDPEEAVRRELEEPDPAAASKTIGMNVDPKARQQLAAAQMAAQAAGGLSPGFRTTARLSATSGGRTAAQILAAGAITGMVQSTAALAVESLPSAFATAARGRFGADTSAAAPGISSADAVPTTVSSRAQPLSVVILSMQGDLLFTFKSSGLQARAEAALGEVAKVLIQHPDLPVLVRGYTDSKGTAEANLALSKKRAESVRDWLVTRTGIKLENITVQGLGAADPVAPNQNPDGSDNQPGREKNRRVTVTIPQQQPPPQLQRQAQL